MFIFTALRDALIVLDRAWHMRTNQNDWKQMRPRVPRLQCHLRLAKTEATDVLLKRNNDLQAQVAKQRPLKSVYTVQLYL